MAEHSHNQAHPQQHTHSPEQAELNTPGQSGEEKPAGSHSGMWRLLGDTRPYRGGLLFTLACGLANHALSIGSAVLAAYLVGKAATGTPASDLWPYFWLLIGLVIGRTIAGWLENLYSHLVAFKILGELRFKMYWALERLAPGYLASQRSGDLATSAMEDVDVLEFFFAHTASQMFVALVVPFGALVGMGLVHPLLPLVLLPWVVLVALVPFSLGKRAEQQGRVVRGKLGELGAEMVDTIQGLREIVVFGQQKTRLKKLAGHTYQFQQAQFAYGQRSGVESAVTISLTALGMVTVLGVAAWLVSQGSLSRSLFPVAVVLAGVSFAPVLGLTDTARNFGLVKAAARRVFTILDEPSPTRDLVASPPSGPLSPSIQFDKVSFRYGPTLTNALDDVSFEVGEGETVALVGHSGAGKSTCANLLFRFWDVTEGKIYLGGYDLRDFPQAELRNRIALMPQDIYLFNISVRENIRLGRPDATDEEVENATRTAQAHEFIRALPQSYETVTGERGVQLSGGQRQRLGIARALLKDAPILVMDEAVSNLDTESERAFQLALSQLVKGRTTLLITHRLSTIRTADRIVVLEAGRVAESGTHEKLLAKNSVYSHLITSQRDVLLAD